jgi:anti-anti-sigma regulatory factor
VLEEARRRCQAAWPGLRICGTHAPPYAGLLALDHDEMTRRIRAAAPDLLLVGLGAPKQEKLIAMHRQEWGVPCSIGVGAGIDFLAGRFSRAPEWMRRSGTEWLFRLLQEPRRLFGRYLRDFLFYFPALAAELLRRPGAAALPPPRPAGGGAVVDLEGLASITPNGLGTLLEARRACREQGGELVLFRPSGAVQRMLRSSRLDRVLRTAATPQEADEILAEGTAAPQLRVGGDGQVLCLELRGELTAPGVTPCRRALLEQWRAHPQGEALELALAPLFALDSAGVALLLELRQIVRQRPGAELRLRGAGRSVREVLERAGAGAL